MQKVSHKLLIISISSPIQLAVYRDNILIDTISSDKKTSQILLPLIMEFLDKYPISQIIYTHGPGSYMSIKLTYIILRTIEIVRDIDFVGAIGFEFNNNQPIKALGNLYFTKEKNQIITQKFDKKLDVKFKIPQNIDNIDISTTKEPLYILPAL